VGRAVGNAAGTYSLYYRWTWQATTGRRP
jgi:hypothetical protein